MTILQAVVLGIVQGVTEFFPISSSGHLVIMQSLFGIEEPQLAFDIFLHLGTVGAVVAYFRKDIVSFFKGDLRTLGLIVIGSVPTFIMGVLFKDIVEKAFCMPCVVGYMLILTGMWISLAHAKSMRPDYKTGPVDAARSVMIGIAQGIAILPGISRSGATISTAMLSGVERSEACRFSFLLSVPAVLGASLFKARDISSGITGSAAMAYLAGGLAAFIAGYLAIRTLLKIVAGKRIYLFGIYCIIAGSLVILFTR